MKRTFPILEFDPNREAYIEPKIVAPEEELPLRCVIAFFRNAIAALVKEKALEPIALFCSGTLDIPIYKTLVAGEEVALVQGYVGALILPTAAIRDEGGC